MLVYRALVMEGDYECHQNTLIQGYWLQKPKQKPNVTQLPEWCFERLAIAS